MAININVPGIGTVTVEGAASEETMRRLLEAMKTMNRKKDSKKREPEEEKAAQSQRSAMEASVAEFLRLQAQVSLTRKMLNGFGTLGKETFGAMKSIVSDIAKTGLAVATNWATIPDQLMDDPIRAGAELINTGIDLLAKSVTTVSDLVGKLAGNLPVLGGMIKGASEAFKGAVELASSVLKVANEFMAAEFQKVTKSFFSLNKIGATFGGGMDELGSLADMTGIGINKFSEAVAASRENITAMGLNVANAAQVVARGLNKLNTETGLSGRKLRDELLTLGFDYQTQGELVAEYTANMISLGKSRADIDRDVAKGTAAYAKDLKLLSDITGQDARKKMEEARKESMRSSLMAKLAPEQREAFRKAYAGLAQAGPEVQNALVQSLAIGTVTDPAVAMNENLMELIRNVTAGVTSGSKTITEDTLTAVAETAENIRNKGRDLGTAIDIAAMAGATGVVATAAKINNNFEAILMTPEQIAQAKAAIDKVTQQSGGTTTDAFVRATNATTEFAVKMEELARSKLPEYSNIIASATEMTKTALNKVIGEASEIAEKGIKAWAEGKMAEIKGHLIEAADKMKKVLLDDFLPAFRTAFANAIEALGNKLREILPSWLTRGSSGPLVDPNRASQPFDPNNPGSGGVAIPGAAEGDILTGPKKGYTALLHGTEAVVPLPDGRNIPVNLTTNVNLADAIDLSRLESIAEKQVQLTERLNIIMAEVSSILNDQKSISQEMLSNSY